MFPLRRFRTSPIFVTIALLGGAVRANAELAATSPFLPPAGMSIAAPTSSAPLEFKGMTLEDGKMKFSIFDPSKKSGTWIGLNETGYDYSVKKYDADAETVTVDYQGRSLTLQMKTSKVASFGTAVAPLPLPAPIPAGPAVPNPVTRNVVANPTPATEAARLADWQAEIQRRREMRAQQMNQPQTAQPAQAQVQPQAQPQPQQQQQQTQPRARANGAGRQRN